MSKVTPRQKELLADFMSEHYIFLFGKFSKSSGKQAKEKKWEEITKLLNDNGPPNKNSEKWKRTWADIKMGVKEKVKLIRQHCNKTGGGPPTTIVLSPFEEKIKNICGNTLMDGDPELKEIGIRKPSHDCSSDSGTSFLIRSINTEHGLDTIDEIVCLDDCVASQTSTVTNTPTSATPTKTSTVSAPATTPRRFNVQQNQVDSALNLQKETNEKLKRIVSQNDEILVAMAKIILLLENISTKD